MFRRLTPKLPAAALLLLSACGLVRCAPDPVDEATLNRLYSEEIAPVEDPLSVFFIGHSLTGRLMPALLAQFAPDGHSYESQLGWGAELQAHWEPDVPLRGAEVENDHPRYRDAHAAVDSGDYDVLVVTEKIGLQAAIDYHDSWHYLALWSAKAWQANPDLRLYMYETWHETTIADGWLARIDRDLPALWQGEIIDRALAETGATRPIRVIPAGQVLARVVRDGPYSKEELLPDGIHTSDLAAYLVALTHYAVLYARPPLGLPHRGLVTEKGTPFTALDTVETAEIRRLQSLVWEVVTATARSGVSAP